jgi:PleD family two-component response regulator
MKRADLALYEAKRAGKNNYCIAASTELLAMVLA